MRRNIIETVLGAVVLVVAGFFLVFAYTSADFQRTSGYQVTADFKDLGGLKVGDTVTIGGVGVGHVSDMSLNSETFEARVTLTIDSDIKLPEDTIAVISSGGLLGGKNISLEPGGAEETIPQQGGHFDFTQSTPGLSQLLGQVIYRLGSLGQSDDTEPQEDLGDF